MEEVIKPLLDTLNSTEAGWVERRDAADALGKLAHKILVALTDHLQDKDMDVQMAVERCVDPIHVILRIRDRTRKQYPLRDLAFACEKHGQRTVETYKAGFVITVRLANRRSHRVYVMPHQLRDGRKIVRLFTLCGEATPEKLSWTLRANSKLSHGAFALLKFNDSEHLAIVNNILKQEATPEMVKRGVKEMAFYGDWLEEKISKMDEF